MMEKAIEHYAERPEQFREMLAFEEGFAALKDEPEDSPEVERVAGLYEQVAESNFWSAELMEESGWAQGPYAHVVADLMSSNFSAAQLRLIQLLDKYFPDAKRAGRGKK